MMNSFQFVSPYWRQGRPKGKATKARVLGFKILGEKKASKKLI